jgi:hypothetical protein
MEAIKFVHNGIAEVYCNKNERGKAAAQFVADTIKAALVKQDKAKVIFATSASQYEFLAALVKIKGIDWKKVTAFHLDEYLGMSDQHPAIFRKYLRERLFNLLPFGAVHLLNGDSADGQAEAKRYSALLAEGDIDLACIGIGENGHRAFNDPLAGFNSPNLVNIVDWPSLSPAAGGRRSFPEPRGGAQAGALAEHPGDHARQGDQLRRSRSAQGQDRAVLPGRSALADVPGIRAAQAR